MSFENKINGACVFIWLRLNINLRTKYYIIVSIFTLMSYKLNSPTFASLNQSPESSKSYRRIYLFLEFTQKLKFINFIFCLDRRHRGLSRDYRDRNKVSKKAARDEHQTNDTKTKKGSSDATNKDTPKKPEFNFDFNFDNQDPQKMPDMKYSMAFLFSILFIYLAYKQFKKRSEEQKMYNEPLDSFEITWTDFLVMKQQDYYVCF